ncbi:hypothetical protein HMPREF9582_00127 [Cutibacterium acnes HL060PA1]|nr:hypothetical protein HMPREF9603_02305 [Cutibacterium acnes HL001PA1]EFT66089.1 hypothetical protein HMPREF9582_00127 [Cutibacterium acnes HL060PA1]
MSKKRRRKDSDEKSTVYVLAVSEHRPSIENGVEFVWGRYLVRCSRN